MCWCANQKAHFPTFSIGGVSRGKPSSTSQILLGPLEAVLVPSLVTMTLELYILPPLFGLPSLSGSCIAALSLCTLSLDPSSFKVNESTDLSLGLPALKQNDTWTRGYTSIKLFLLRENDIDSDLSASEKADSVAWGSIIEDLGETLTVFFLA